jgi:DNA-binding winged helix-turn-helix (wHTH) protein/TolB-like protein
LEELRLGSRAIQPHRQLLAEGQHVHLGKRALDILSVLAEAQGEIVTKDELLEAVWPGIIVEENALQVHIVALRKALGPEAERLKTIRGVGYQLHVDEGAGSPSTPELEPDMAPLPSAAPPARASADPLPRAFYLPVPKRSLAALGIAVLLLLALAGAWWFAGPSLGLRSEERIRVLVRAMAASGSGEPAEAALARGITDELIVRLRRVPGLRIATAQPNGTAPAAAFERSYVLDGHIRSADDRVRVTARLSGADGEILWSETFDRKMADLFDVQERIASSIAGALSVSFDVGGDSSEFGGTDNPDAYSAYLQFRANQTNPDQNVPLHYLKRALTLDSDYGKALNSLSVSYGIRASQATSREEAVRLLAEMDRRTARAVEANPGLWVTHLARGWYHIQRRNLVAADREMRQVARLDKGNDPELRINLAGFSYSLGRTRRGLSFAQGAALIDPVHRGSMDDIWGLLFAGLHQESLNAFHRRATEDPSISVTASRWAFWALLLLGKEDDALQLAQQHSLELADDWQVIQDNVALADMSKAELRRWAAHKYGSGGLVRLTNLALFASHYGKPQLAMDLLEVARERVGGYYFIPLWHPAMANARKTDRFERLVIDLGFVRAWRKSGDWGDYCRPISVGEITCS